MGQVWWAFTIRKNEENCCVIRSIEVDMGEMAERGCCEMAELNQVIAQINKNIEFQTKYFQSLMEGQNKVIENQTVYFESKFDAQSKRQDAHGAEQKAGFEGLNHKADSFLNMKVRDDKETHEKISQVSSRVKVLEEKRISGREFMVMLIAIVGCFSSIFTILKYIKP